jgi:hypothetical protein
MSNYGWLSDKTHLRRPFHINNHLQLDFTWRMSYLTPYAANYGRLPNFNPFQKPPLYLFSYGQKVEAHGLLQLHATVWEVGHPIGYRYCAMLISPCCKSPHKLQITSCVLYQHIVHIAHVPTNNKIGICIASSQCFIHILPFYSCGPCPPRASRAVEA